MNSKKLAAAMMALLLIGTYSSAQKGEIAAGCYATSVISSAQGPVKGGGSIAVDRSDPAKALGVPQGTDYPPSNFFSLGFGGNIVLYFDCKIVNTDGDDFVITETTNGNQPCANYPEYVHAYASKDGSTWTDLGTKCQDAAFDLGALDWARYVKLVDESNMQSNLPNGADGYDVDGITARHCDCSGDPLPEFSSIAAVLAVLVMAPAAAYLLKRKH